MKIVCNGKDKEVRDGLAIEELILDLELDPDTVVAECDGAIILRQDYPDHRLTEGAVVELIRFVGGG